MPFVLSPLPIRVHRALASGVILVGGSDEMAAALARAVGVPARCGLDELTEARLASVHTVGCAWVDAGGFDCLDVAAALTAQGWAGPFVVALPPVPDPEMVRREIQRQAPTLAVSLLTL